MHACTYARTHAEIGRIETETEKSIETAQNIEQNLLPELLNRVIFSVTFKLHIFYSICNTTLGFGIFER